MNPNNDTRTEMSPLKIITTVLGPTQTNTYIIADSKSKSAVLIDPAGEGASLVKTIEDNGWHLAAIWLTHAHFDHFMGAGEVTNALESSVEVALHPNDLPLWRALGGAKFWGLPAFDPGPEPVISLEHQMELHLGENHFIVRHTPGHTPGHVIFIEKEQGVVICGDLVFKGSVGRTDLPGGSWDTLLKSIQEEILTLPDEYTLLSGHGPATNVGDERKNNPFIKGAR
jgi:hydroxyacylglutathione hydrolase